MSAPAPNSAPPFARTDRDPRLANYLADYSPDLFSETLYQSIELMERYSIELSLEVLSQLGIFPLLQRERSAAELATELSFAPKFVPALDWLLRRVVETGCVEAVPSTGKYRQVSNCWSPDLTAIRRIGLELAAGNAPTLDLLDYAASLYPLVARGESGDAALFSPQGITLWLSYFSNANLTYAVNNWLAAVLARQCLAGRDKLRLLELGAGAGSASEILLREFSQHDLRRQIELYRFTEPNAFFRRRAQRELARQHAEVPFEFGTLDLDQPWEGQNDFELVYGVNVFHVAHDLLPALERARAALRPGGWLVLGECLRPHESQPMYPELIFQVLDSFNSVTLIPELRPVAGFLTSGQWRGALHAAGFSQVQIKPAVEQILSLYSHFFTGAIAGRRPT